MTRGSNQLKCTSALLKGAGSIKMAIWQTSWAGQILFEFNEPA